MTNTANMEVYVRPNGFVRIVDRDTNLAWREVLLSGETLIKAVQESHRLRWGG